MLQKSQLSAVTEKNILEMTENAMSIIIQLEKLNKGEDACNYRTRDVGYRCSTSSLRDQGTLSPVDRWRSSVY
jgi:hypothetical protein